MACLLNVSNWTSLDNKLNKFYKYTNKKNNMKNLKLFSLILTSVLLGCFGNRNTFDKESNISKFGQPSKIEYFKHIDSYAFNVDSIPTFTIKNKTEIKEALEEIRNASNREPWKGAGWDRIVLTYNDTIIKISTNKKKIGLGASGSFYDLDRNNFITKRLNEK
jgi:hypothetical protein